MKDIGQGMRWLLRLPLRVLSLRTIVVVAALAVIVLVLVLGTWVWVGVTDDQYSQLDRRLDSVSSLGDVSNLLNSTPGIATPSAHARRQRRADRPDRRHHRLGAQRRRAAASSRTATRPPTSTACSTGCAPSPRASAIIALGAPLAETQHRIDELHLRVLLICGGVIAGTVLVGWVISLIMINPFRLLAQQARAINAQSKPDEVQVRGVREAVEIAEAVEGMLARIGRRAAAHQGRAGIGPRLRRRRLPRTAHPADGHAHQPRGAVHPGPGPPSSATR